MASNPAWMHELKGKFKCRSCSRTIDINTGGHTRPHKNAGERCPGSGQVPVRIG